MAEPETSVVDPWPDAYAEDASAPGRLPKVPDCTPGTDGPLPAPGREMTSVGWWSLCPPGRQAREAIVLAGAEARGMAQRSRGRHAHLRRAEVAMAQGRAEAALRDPLLAQWLRVATTGMGGPTADAELVALRQAMVLIRHALGALHPVAVETEPLSHCSWPCDGGADFGAAGPPGQVVAADPCRRHAPPRASSPHRREAAVAA